MVGELPRDKVWNMGRWVTLIPGQCLDPCESSRKGIYNLTRGLFKIWLSGAGVGGMVDGKCRGKELVISYTLLAPPLAP